MRRLSLLAPLLLLVTALAGCGAGGGSSTPSGPDRADPAAVNAAWVAAVRDIDREAATALYDAGSAEANSYNVSHYLSSMASYVHPVGKQPSNYGAFKTVEILNVSDVGVGKRAFSRWVFANTSLCYYAELTQTGGKWIVTTWGATFANPCGE